jgi:peroxiredoxin
MEAFTEKKIAIVAGSTENLEDAQKFVERRKLEFRVAFNMDAKEFAARTGAFYNADKGYLHATGFIIRPDGTIDEAVYSTGPVGRLIAADALRLIDYRSRP